MVCKLPARTNSVCGSFMLVKHDKGGYVDHPPGSRSLNDLLLALDLCSTSHMTIQQSLYVGAACHP